jgi:hypothetical protein
MVDNASNTSYDLTVAIGQEILRLAEFEGSILVLAQRMNIVAVQVGGIILVTPIQVVVELDESIKLFPVGDFSNLYW